MEVFGIHDGIYKFPIHLMILIINCVTSTEISILFNGGLVDPIKPLRGLRQEDPLSPYFLFSAWNA